MYFQTYHNVLFNFDTVLKLEVYELFKNTTNGPFMEGAKGQVNTTH